MPIRVPAGVNQLPTDIDPKEASVLDPAWKSVARKLVGFMGWDDPNTVAMGAASPLVSIYPDKAAREIGTSKFLESARNFGNANIAKAGDWLAKNYPRVAAHMTINPELASGTWAAQTKIPFGTVREPLQVTFSGVGNQLASDAKDTAKKYMAHEATHVAQALGNNQMELLYNLANKEVGYHANPFERSAKIAERQATGRGVDRLRMVSRKAVPVAGSSPTVLPSKKTWQVFTANKGLNDIVNKDWENVVETGENSPVADAIRKILRNRGTLGQ